MNLCLFFVRQFLTKCSLIDIITLLFIILKYTTMQKWGPKLNRTNSSIDAKKVDTLSNFIKQLDSNFLSKNSEVKNEIDKEIAALKDSIIQKLWLPVATENSLIQEYSNAFKEVVNNIKEWWTTLSMDTVEWITVLHVGNDKTIATLEESLEPLSEYYDMNIEDWVINLLDINEETKIMIAIDKETTETSFEDIFTSLENVSLFTMGQSLDSFEKGLEKINDSTETWIITRFTKKLEEFSEALQSVDWNMISKFFPDIVTRIEKLFATAKNKLSYIRENYELVTLSGDSVWTTLWMWNMPAFFKKKWAEKYLTIKKQKQLNELLSSVEENPLLDSNNEEIDNEKFETTMHELVNLKKSWASKKTIIRSIHLKLKITDKKAQMKLYDLINKEANIPVKKRLQEVKKLSKEDQKIFNLVKEQAKIRKLELNITNEQILAIKNAKIEKKDQVSEEKILENIAWILESFKGYDELTRSKILDVIFTKKVLWPYPKDLLRDDLNTTEKWDKPLPITSKIWLWIKVRKDYWSWRRFWFTLAWFWASVDIWNKAERVVKKTAETMESLTEWITSQAWEVSNSIDWTEMNKADQAIDSAEATIEKVKSIHNTLKEIWNWNPDPAIESYTTKWLDIISKWQYSKLMNQLESVNNFDDATEALNKAYDLLWNVDWNSQWIESIFLELTEMINNVWSWVDIFFDINQAISWTLLVISGLTMHWIYNSEIVSKGKFTRMALTWIGIGLTLLWIYYQFWASALQEISDDIINKMNSIEEMLQYYLE